MRGKIALLVTVVLFAVMGPWVLGASAQADATFYFFHAEQRVSQVEQVAGEGPIFDTKPPTGGDYSVAPDVYQARNGSPQAIYDPAWTGEIKDPVRSLTVDFFQKQLPGEPLGSVTYNVRLWLGEEVNTIVSLPSFTAAVAAGVSPTRVVNTFKTMLNAEGKEVPLSVKPAGPVTIVIAGSTSSTSNPNPTSPTGAGTVILYDSEAYPSGFGINGATRPGGQGSPAPSPSGSLRPSPSASPSPSPSPLPSPSPTQAPGKEHDRDISLGFAHRGGALVAKGTVFVADGYNKCRKRVLVKIENRKRGKWATVDGGNTNRKGRYRIKLRDRRGKYRATAPQERKGPNGSNVCERASTARRHRH